MELHTWWLFVGMTFVVSATPGPNMLLVMRTSARSGFRSALGSMAGCMTSLLAMMSISAAGLGALLHTFPAVFDALRLMGAAYLGYLGWSCWRAPVDDAQEGQVARQLAGDSGWALYRQGALVAASNPKAILFAAAFFPQFIQPSLPKLPQFGILLATFTVIEVGWYLVYALSGHSLSHYLKRPRVRRAFNRLTGGAFMGFAALMAGVRS
jgi:threonine/homoserine/homoserine lactone efflux protein